jgi:hypothetical protein
MKFSGQTSLKMQWGKKKILLLGLVQRKLGKPRLRFVTILIVRISTGLTEGNVDTVSKIVNEDRRLPFWRRLAG